MGRVSVLLVLVMAGFLLRGQDPPGRKAENRLDEQGRKTGYWKVEYPGGKILYEAMFMEGRPVGEMVRYYKNGGIKARMEFDSLSDASFTTLYYKSGKPAAEGWYIQREKDSVWTYYSEFDGTIRVREPYRQGSLEGTVSSYYPDGEISEEVNWQQNRKEGEWRQYYKTGSPRLNGHYKNDQLNGPYEVYYADSSIKIRGNYLDNLSHGTWTYYDESGKALFSMEFSHGIPVDQEKYELWLQDTLQKYEPITEPGSDQQF